MHKRHLAYRREGQWLDIYPADIPLKPEAEADNGLIEAGSHPHLVRQWLLARSLFPAKWVNRLFSVGGIRWSGESLQLLAFPTADVDSDSLYRKARLTMGEELPSVLYEDEFCMVLNKPAGMPVHESYSGQLGTLDEAAARYLLAAGDPLPVRHIHRLDDDTSGPVLYTKNDLAQWRLDEAMRHKQIDRRYIAVVHGRISKRSGIIDAPISKDRHHPSRRRAGAGGDAAVTHFETIEILGEASVVRLQLETGRTHQIRVHMSYMGHPLIGDHLYGGDDRLLAHQALHGERLLFAHPWTGQLEEAQAPAPAWLAELIDKLRQQTK